jgi:amino acid transporter
MLIGIILVNLAGVKYFGEFEFGTSNSFFFVHTRCLSSIPVFAFIKIITVIGLVIVLLVVDLGGAPDHDRRGFRYWRDQPFNNSFFDVVPESKARFLGFWAVLTQAAFSCMFLLIEPPAQSDHVSRRRNGGSRHDLSRGFQPPCHHEDRCPRHLLPHCPSLYVAFSTDSIFILTSSVDVFSILLIGMCLSRDNEHLLQAVAQGASTAAQSPFVIIIQSSGIKVLDHIISE